MAKKKSFVLRLDESMFAAIEKWAADEFRSTNGQIEWILATKLKEAGRYKPGLPDHKTREIKEDSPPSN